MTVLRAALPPLLAAALAFAACGTDDTSQKYPPGVGPGGPLADGGTDGAREGGSVAADGAPLDLAICASDTSPGTRTVICEGLEVALAVPSECPEAGCGLILDLHGALMNANLHDAHTELRARGSAKGYVVVQPTAPKRTFQSLTGPQWFNADDEALFRLVSAVARDLSVDKKRIHATGFSQGGFATLRLMCAHADLFASVAPGGAGAQDCPLDGAVVGACPFTDGARPSRAIDVLFMYGRKDALIPKECAEKQIAAIAEGFKLGPAAVLTSDGAYARKRYESPGATMDTLEHDYEAGGTFAFNDGHCFPGSNASGTAWDDIACTGANAFVWGTEVVTFFESHAD